MKNNENGNYGETNDRLTSSFVFASHWKLDLDFYKDELKFLSNLLSKYFIYLIEDYDLESLNKLAGRLNETKNVCNELSEDITDYLSKIKLLMTNELSLDNFYQRREYIILETSLKIFIKSLKSLKRDIFTVTEEVLQHKKMLRLVQA